MRSLFATLCLLCLPWYSSAQECERSPLDGIFFQPLYVDLELRAGQWDERIAALKQSGVDRFFLQWTVYGEADFLNLYTADGRPFLLTLANALERHGIELILGLVADPQWFAKVESLQGQALNNYLAALRLDTIRQAGNILSEYPDLEIAGWYLPEEIAGVHWREKDRLDILLNHFQQIAIQLRRFSPDPTLYVSAFASEFGEPGNYIDVLTRLSEVLPIFILHQDGSGTRAISSTSSAYIIEELHRKLDNDRWGIIVELFRQQPTADGTFLAVPTESDELIAQFAHHAERIPDIHIAGFSLRYLLEDGARLLNELMASYCND